MSDDTPDPDDYPEPEYASDIEESDDEGSKEATPDDVAEIERRYGKSISELAEEAERGYDPDRIGERRSTDRPPPDDQIETWHTHQQEMGRTDTSSTLAPLQNASAQDWLGSNQDPDVLLAIPNLGVDHIGLNVRNLKAHVELHAKVLDLLELHVGADASIEEVDLQIDNVRVQAMLKVKLQEVTKIVGRVMDTIDANPEILTNLTAGLGKGLEAGLGKESAVAIEEGDGRLKGVEGTKGDWEQSPELEQPDWSKEGGDG